MDTILQVTADEVRAMPTRVLAILALEKYRRRLDRMHRVDTLNLVRGRNEGAFLAEDEED